MALRIFISGTEYVADSSFSLKQQGGAVASTSLSVKCGANPIPRSLQSVQVTIDNVPVFAGIIKRVKYPTYRSGFESQDYQLECQSLEAILNFRVVNRTFYSMTYSEIVGELFASILTEENITLGEITETTEPIKRYQVQHKKLYDVLVEIADKVGGATFYISPGRAFYFIKSDDFASASVPAKLTDVSLSEDYSDLRTMQTVKGASSRIVGTAQSAVLIAEIAALNGTSGKIESVESDSAIHNPTAANTEAAARLADYDERELSLSCLCHDLTASLPFNMWPVDLPSFGIVGYFVVTDRTISYAGDKYSIQVNLKNRNFFTRFGYATKAALVSAYDAKTGLWDIANDERFTPAEKKIWKPQWETIFGEKPGFDGQGAAYGITTELAAYDAAFQALADYLNGGDAWTSGIPAWFAPDEMSVTEDIDPDEFAGAWDGYYAARQALTDAITLAVMSVATEAQTRVLSSLSETGAYDGEVAFFQGRVYQWSTDQSVWVLSSAIIPTDAWAHYSFNALPLIPDNTAGTTYLSNWSSGVDGWIANTGCVIAAESLRLKITYTAGSNNGCSAYRVMNITSTGARFKVTSTNVIQKVRLRHYPGGTANDITYTTPTVKISDYIWIIDMEGIASNNLIAININNAISVDANNVAWIDFIYIGTKAYDIPLLDNSGNLRHASVFGALPIPGVSGNGLLFDGIDDYTLLPSALWNIAGAFSISAWIKGTAVAAYILTKYGAAGQRSFLFMTGAVEDGKPALRVSGDGTNLVTVSSSVAVNDGNWHHVFGVFIPSTAMYIFVDGVLTGTNTTGIPASMFSSTAPVYQARSGSTYTAVSIDELRLYQLGLSAPEALGLFLAPEGNGEVYDWTDYLADQAAIDGVITPQEKVGILQNWTEINGNGSTTGSYWTAYNRATALSVPTVNLAAARVALSNALYGSSPTITPTPILSTSYWATVITLVSASLYKGLWSTYRSEEAAILNAIAAKEALDVQVTIPTYSPKYLGIGRLSAVGTAAFAGYSVDSAGNITSTGTVTPNVSDWMINYYNAGVATLGIYRWTGQAWTLDNSVAKIDSCAIDLCHLVVAGITISGFTTFITAIIKTLFVQSLTLLSGGTFQSSNYSAGSAGFKITGSTGLAEFMNMVINGEIGTGGVYSNDGKIKITPSEISVADYNQKTGTPVNTNKRTRITKDGFYVDVHNGSTWVNTTLINGSNIYTAKLLSDISYVDAISSNGTLYVEGQVYTSKGVQIVPQSSAPSASYGMFTFRNSGVGGRMRSPNDGSWYGINWTAGW